jgi:bifunctional non-homologous end joining protein LigD
MVRSGQEGVVAKRRSSPYRMGARSTDWIKIKNIQSDDFIVVGYWSSGKHGLSSLLLGSFASAAHARAGRHLRFCGKVGTGFGDQERASLHKTLDRLARLTPPCDGDLPREAGVTWCEPRMVVQIRFTEWTHDGALRHPSFAGLRSDKEVHQVIHPETAPIRSAALHRG